MGVICPSCENAVSNTYGCRDCGGTFCVDCRLPDDHECAATVEADGGTRTAGDPWDLSVTVPAGPRITAFVPAWRVLPWWVYVLLAVVLFPLTTVILAQQVYHERVTASEYAWRPSRVYYVPLLVFTIALLMSRPSLPGINTHWVVMAVFGYFWGLPATVIYAVQRRGR